VADDADDLRIDQLLGDGVADLRVGLVVFGDQFELDGRAADLDAGRVGFVDGETSAVFIVLAEVGDAAGERADVAELDDGGDRCSRGGGCGGRLGGFFFLAAAHHQDGGGNRQGKDFDRGIHSGGLH